MTDRAIVAHHDPDLDAVGAVWLLKRFDSQRYATAKVLFVNPGETLSYTEAEANGLQLHQVTHVDTGLGEFDHHQADRAKQMMCASSLVHEYLIKLQPDLAKDAALKLLIDHINDVDHFLEIHWPEADSSRYAFQLHALLEGYGNLDPRNDESQLHFGMTALDSAYAYLRQYVEAHEELQNGQKLSLAHNITALAIATKNNRVIQEAQKSGIGLVIMKHPEQGYIRIKVRPDVAIDLTALDKEIRKKDNVGTWFLHGSGKMLLNGSSKHRNQTPSPLTLEEVVELVQKLYGN
jgi:hypothetical protein